MTAIVANGHALEDGHTGTDPYVVSDPNDLSNTVAPFGSRDNHIQRCACTQIQRVGSFCPRSRITALGSQNSNPSQLAFQHLCEHKMPKARKMYIVWRLETSRA